MQKLLSLKKLLKESGLAVLIGISSGCLSAFFLIALEWVTDYRVEHPKILFVLPLSGFLIGWVYHRYGREVEAGNDLLLEEIHNPTKVIPLRMTPLVLLGTLLTHLFGGSAGREGTAVQMGGSVADQFTHLFRLDFSYRRTLLMAGISGGFASVFGTPLAGAIFGLEVLYIGKIHYEAILPCFIAAIIGYHVTGLWGVSHAHYPIPYIPEWSSWNLLRTLIAGSCFGLSSRFFVSLTHAIKDTFQKIKYPPLRPFIGGILFVVATLLIGSDRFLGLGLPTISSAFHAPVAWSDFIGKTFFTSLTLGSGFKGGEVTPLFFIGATLGNALSAILSLPLPLLAGMGFVAVFAGAANTPVASTLLAVELFGPKAGVYVALAAVVSYLCSGHRGIYKSQRMAVSKNTQPSIVDS